MNGWYYDIEADSLFLQSTKIWYIKFKSLDGSKQLSVLPFREDCKDKISEWINSFPDNSLVVGHNILSYDSWMLWKFFDIKPRVGKGGKDTLNGKKVQFVDTLVLSQYLQPDLQSHSLDFLSSGSESTKMDYRKALVEADAMVGNEPKGFEFSFYHPLIEEYCDADVEAGIGVFNRLWNKAVEMYGEKNWIHPSFRQLQKDFFLYAAQAYSGVKFDKEKAVVLVQHITEKMDELKAQVDPVLPPRELKEGEKKEYKIPVKPFTKSGEMSATMVKWLDKHNAKVIDNKIHAYGFVVDIVANDILPVRPPMEIEDNAELKQYFLDHGWVPSDDHWNFKKGDDGKPIRDDRNNYIKTTPKIMNAGVICPNLLKIEADVPAKVVKFLSYRNRRSVVEGWLANWRIEWDGRLSAEISGYTPTFRVKHKSVCNVPKADPKVLLGNEMRELFTVDKRFHYVGTDSAALENRTLAAYTMKYDGGAFADLILKGDSHAFNSFAFFPHLHEKFDINQEGLKDVTEFKPWRNKAKTGAYLLAYGGGVAKLASSLGLSKKDAQTSYDNYWSANPGLGKLKENVERYYDTTGKKKFVPGWDGRILSIRRKNVLINCLGQNLGAVCQSIAACMMDNKLGEMYLDEKFRPYYLYKGRVVKRVSLFHDEYSWEVEDGIEEEIRQLTVECIIKAGEYLKLPLPLDGEGKVGRTWRCVH